MYMYMYVSLHIQCTRIEGTWEGGSEGGGASPPHVRLIVRLRCQQRGVGAAPLGAEAARRLDGRGERGGRADGGG